MITVGFIISFGILCAGVSLMIKWDDMPVGGWHDILPMIMICVGMATMIGIFAAV